MQIEIAQYAHDDDELWRLAGRFFADARVRRELGRPMTSAPGYVWWLAFENGAVAGWAALEPLPRQRAELRHAYVLPQYRRNGIYRALLQARIEYARDRYTRLETTATANSQPQLERVGFVIHSKRGRYARLHLILRRGQ